jgi:putative transposase
LEGGRAGKGPAPLAPRRPAHPTRIVREQFLVEIGDGAGVRDLAALNALFTAWYESVYHARSHGETGQPPMDRWQAGAPFPVPSAAQLREAFLWAEWRLVRKDATIKLFGSTYETGPELAGRKVELIFDPFDMTMIEVRWNGTPCGIAVPQHIRRHSHPKARPETPAGPPPGTGIDYLAVIAAEHNAARAQRIRYDALAPSQDQPASSEQAPPVNGQPPAVATCEISQLLAWAARLTAAGPRASTAETAAYLTAKADLLERIAAERAAAGWTAAETGLACQAAAAARTAAAAATTLAAAGVTTMED